MREGWDKGKKAPRQVDRPEEETRRREVVRGGEVELGWTLEAEGVSAGSSVSVGLGCQGLGTRGATAAISTILSP